MKYLLRHPIFNNKYKKQPFGLEEKVKYVPYKLVGVENNLNNKLTPTRVPLRYFRIAPTQKIFFLVVYMKSFFLYYYIFRYSFS